MKKERSIIGPFIAACFFAALLYLSHSSIYLQKSSINFYPLQSFVQQPYDFQGLPHQHTIQPDYLSPHLKFQYLYSSESRDQILVIEEADSLFNDRLRITEGDVSAYDPELTDQNKTRSFNVTAYPNIFFFVLQYLIALAIVYNILVIPFRLFGRRKKRSSDGITDVPLEEIKH